MSIGLLLWDFGDTLADQRWMWSCPPGVDAWTDTYRGVVGEIGARWDRGSADLNDIVTALSERLSMPTAAVLAHIEDRCADLDFFDGVWRAARAASLPQALVTVNPDVFSRFVVPNYRLDEMFAAIVTSSEVRSDDKTRLCEVAMRRLGCPDRGRTLLIDNIEANCEAWRRSGGNAYWFRGDDEFVARLKAGGWDGLGTSA